MNGGPPSWLIFFGGLVAAALLVLIFALVGDDSADTESAADTTPTTTASTTLSTGADPSVATTSIAAPTTTAAAAPACPGAPVPIPGSATDLTTSVGDMDGDLSPDEFSIYADGGTWYAHVELANGLSTRTAITPWDPGAVPWSESVMNVGNAEELGLAGTGFTLVGPIFGVWQFADCELHRATLDGGPFEPYSGIGPAHSEGFGCTADGMIQYEAAQPGSDEDVWSVTEYPYLWLPGLGEFESLPVNSFVTDRASAMALTSQQGC